MLVSISSIYCYVVYERYVFNKVVQHEGENIEALAVYIFMQETIKKRWGKVDNIAVEYFICRLFHQNGLYHIYHMVKR